MDLALNRQHRSRLIVFGALLGALIGALVRSLAVADETGPNSAA